MELYLNCNTLANFEDKEHLCCELLGLPNEGAEHYAKPLIDINGNHWLIINNEVQSILSEAELAQCVEFSTIQLPENDI